MVVGDIVVGRSSLRELSRPRAFTVIALAYVVAFVAAWYALDVAELALSPLWRTALADVVATLVIFAFSFACDNSSVYDPYWSVAPIAIALHWGMLADPSVPRFRQWLVLAVIVFWGARLTVNWVRGWQGFAQEDWRYVEFRRKTGPLYWPVSLLAVHLFPTAIVFAGMCGAWVALVEGLEPLGPLDGLATIVAFGAVFVELIADEQLHLFRRDPQNAGKIMDRGLWRYSRHPNYFGEVSFWWSLGLFGLAAQRPFPWWVLAGPIAMVALFVFASVPMLDQRSVARRAAYREHIRRTSALIPWFPKR